ncbi:MAG: glycosyltransferase family 2 protein [Acidobacteria bacterium]|nr:glycosyltransferase family 2 protein [Acidobacteriota bacterium]
MGQQTKKESRNLLSANLLVSSSTPTVSVLIATYNQCAALRITIESLLNQELNDFEAWIVGDACTDESEAVVKSFSDWRLQWINLAVNSGSPATPYNEGLRRAQGKYVAYVDHDDLWLPRHLSALVNFIEQRTADLVTSLLVFVGPEGPRSCIGSPRNGLDYQQDDIPTDIACSSWLHRHDLIDACGPWLEPDRLGRSLEYDFVMRAHQAGKKISFSPTLTVLKFPSPEFRAYALKDRHLPQLKYLEGLKKNPEQVELRVLAELAIALRLRPHWREHGVGAHLWRALQVLQSKMLDRLGRERAAVAAFLKWNFQRRRNQDRLRRGLAPRPQPPLASAILASLRKKK